MIRRMHNPSRYPVGSPERALLEYARAWKAQDAYGLLARVQTYWKLRQTEPLEALRQHYAGRELLGFLIQRGQIRRDLAPDPLGFFVFADIPVTYSIALPNGERSTVRTVARLLREGADGKPRELEDVTGSFGVNPISLLNTQRTSADMRYITSGRLR